MYFVYLSFAFLGKIYKIYFFINFKQIIDKMLKIFYNPDSDKTIYQSKGKLLVNINIKNDSLTPEIFINLREKVNFKYYSYEDVKIALKNTLYSVIIYDEDNPVGMGRIVGDDRIVFFIKDIVVDPDYQNKKIGQLIMNNIFDYISTKACEGAYIGLMSTTCCVDFYKKFGFIERPNNDFGPGMVKFYSSKEVVK